MIILLPLKNHNWATILLKNCLDCLLICNQDGNLKSIIGSRPLRKVTYATSKPRSWFGPNGLYIRELPCPICRGRGYTPCIECGVERPRSDCLKCNGKGIVTCHQCLGDCVIWEESIDEQPWEKARSISPLKVKEDDEVDKLDIKLDVRRKTKRVYHPTAPEVSLKISKSLKFMIAEPKRENWNF